MPPLSRPASRPTFFDRLPNRKRGKFKPYSPVNRFFRGLLLAGAAEVGLALVIALGVLEIFVVR